MKTQRKTKTSLVRRRFTLLLLMIAASNSFQANSQTITDTIGSTIVEISVAVDTNHFQGGYASGPWDLYWGPDNKLWFGNQKNLCTYDPQTLIVDTILSLPSGYIMGVTADKDFFQNPYVYLCIDTAYYYGGGQLIRVYRYDYSLSGDSLYNPLLLLSWRHGGEHSGGRIIHGLDDKLYISTAEYHMSVDSLFNNSGKVLRANTDGTVPGDNPRPDYTYSFGHRNPQGILQVPNGNIFVSEYGQGQDELNLILRNRYYGWMIYDGNTCFSNPDTCSYYDTIAVFPINAAMNPPSGIDYYNHAAIPEFNGIIQAVTGYLKQGIIAYTMNAAYDSVIQKNFYLTQEYGRVRDVCSAPDGSVYFIAFDRSNADIRRISNPLFNGIDPNNRERIFSYYPNPASRELFLKINSGEPALISISDLSGKIIYSREISEKLITISLENFTSGCYFIAAKNKDGSSSVNKLIVAK